MAFNATPTYLEGCLSGEPESLPPCAVKSINKIIKITHTHTSSSSPVAACLSRSGHGQAEQYATSFEYYYLILLYSELFIKNCSYSNE
jgi:hypothetical protein